MEAETERIKKAFPYTQQTQNHSNSLNLFDPLLDEKITEIIKKVTEGKPIEKNERESLKQWLIDYREKIHFKAQEKRPWS